MRFWSETRRSGATPRLRVLLLSLLASLALAGCGSTSPKDAPTQTESVSVNPVSANATIGGETVAFSATIKNGTGGVLWQVNGIDGGNSTVGTISASGLYSSPASMPSNTTVTITAQAADNPTDSGSASVTLLPPGATPTVSVAPTTAKVAAAGGTQVFVATVGNVSNTAVTWSVNGTIGGDTTVGTISSSGLYTAPAVPPATEPVQVTAPSAADANVSATALVTVIDSNTTPPSISGTPATSVMAGTAYAFTPTASSPRSGATLAFTISNKPSWASFNAATGQLSGTPSASNVGSTSGIVISVDDGTATASLPAFTLTVTASTSPPTIGGTPPTSVAAGSSYTFTPTASSPRSGATLRFSITNQPSWATFSSTTGTLSGTPSAANVGSTTGIVISVNDGTASASLPAFTLTVTASTAPPTIGGTPPTTVAAGSTYSFTPTASSPRSGATLTFSISGQPSWASFNTANGQLTGTPTANDIGTYANITISVNDGTASASLAAFTITVQAGSTSSVTLTWTAPTTRTDGSALTNLAGYNIYYGNAVGNYTTKVPVPGTSTLTYVITNLPTGATYYFVATAYDLNGIESAYTNPVSSTLP